MYILSITWSNYDGGMYNPLYASNSIDTLIELRNRLFDRIYYNGYLKYDKRIDPNYALTIYNDCIKIIMDYTTDVPISASNRLRIFIKEFIADNTQTSYTISELFDVDKIPVIMKGENNGR